MPLNNDIQLIKQLRKLGFDSITNEVDSNIKAGNKNFTVIYSNKIDDDSLLYVLQFEKVENKITLAGYGLTMQSIVIPKAIIKEIDTAELEARMIKADDLYNDYYISGKAITNEDTKIIESGKRDLQSLLEAGGTGREISQLLMFKYWPETNYREFIPDVESLKENYQVELQVVPNREKLLTAEEAYKEAKGFYYVQKVKSMNEEHVISDSLFEQAQFEISFGRKWVAYNTVPYFLDKGDVYFFKNKEDSVEFSDNNISEYDDYRVINIKSIQDFLLQIPYGRFEGNRLTNFLNKNLSIMNEKNYDYLKNQLKYTGFGEGLQNELKEKMEKQTPEFTIYHQQDFGKDNTSTSLQFKKSEASDMYFFNRYNLVVRT